MSAIRSRSSRFARDLAKEPHREARAGERLPHDELAFEAEITARRARTSSLNRSRSGSTSLKFMRSGRPPTLWWLLIDRRRPADRCRLDHVRIQRALPEVTRSRRARSPRCSNTSMNVAPMILRFCSGSVTPASRSRNRSLASTKSSGRCSFSVKRLLIWLRFVVAQQPVVDEDARQPIADGAMDQHRGHRGIDAAGEAADDLARRPDLLADPRRRFFDERGDRPVAAAAADVVGEVPQDLEAVIGVHDLGMEQQRIEARARGDSIATIGAVALVAATAKPGRHRRDVVAVAGPHAKLRRDVREQRRLRASATRRPARGRTRDDPSAATCPPSDSGHQLHAIADAEHRNVQVEDRRVAFRRAVVIHAAWVRRTG